MGTKMSQITSLTIVYSTVYSDADERIHQRSASLAFVRGIQRWPVNSPHNGPVTQKMFLFDDVIMALIGLSWLRWWSATNSAPNHCLNQYQYMHFSDFRIWFWISLCCFIHNKYLMVITMNVTIMVWCSKMTTWVRINAPLMLMLSTWGGQWSVFFKQYSYSLSGWFKCGSPQSGSISTCYRKIHCQQCMWYEIPFSSGTDGAGTGTWNPVCNVKRTIGIFWYLWIT